MQLLIAVLNLTCLPLLRARFPAGWPGQLLLAAWLGGMGLLVGAILPLGMRVLDRLPAGQSAGLLNAGDYLGGAVGSLLMAAFFLPLLGTGNSLLLISLLSLVSAALLLLAAVRRTGLKRQAGVAAGGKSRAGAERESQWAGASACQSFRTWMASSMTGSLRRSESHSFLFSLKASAAAAAPSLSSLSAVARIWAILDLLLVELFGFLEKGFLLGLEFLQVQGHQGRFAAAFSGG